MEHYDVIIIGTGAGGGTLAHRLAPSGKRILLLERGGYLPREPENWDSREVFRKERYLDGESGSTRTAQPFQPAPAVLRRRQHEVLRRDPVPPARARLRRGPPLRRRLARRGRSPTPTSSPTTPRPSELYLVHGAARRGPDRAVALGPVSRIRPSSHEPRIQQLARRLRAHRPPSVPPAGRRRPRRVRTRGGPRASAATASTASRA